MSQTSILPGTEKPDLETVPSFFRNYVEQAEGEHFFDSLEIALDRTYKLAKTLPENGGLLKYAEDKWTINEILQHIIDTERILSYRALRFARQDSTPLLSFDHNGFVPASKANRRRTDLILKELTAVRMSTIAMFVSFSEEMLLSKGVASDVELSVQTLGWIIAGHNTHHLRVILDRYF